MKALGDTSRYKGENNLLVSDERISDVCLKVLKNDWSCVFALSLLLDLLHSGLQPSEELKATLEPIRNSDPEVADADHATAVCCMLQKCDPLPVNYWYWYKTTLLRSPDITGAHPLISSLGRAL
jgi:protein farnesyltransferase/geranylgeranyltransferase type-1 subunit alpha